jgi:outer membrane protein OmpA-like peptidoglycan-associated protein
MADGPIMVRGQEFPRGAHQVTIDQKAVTLQVSEQVCTGEPICTLSFTEGGQEVRLTDNSCDGVERVRGRLPSFWNNSNTVMQSALRQLVPDFSFEMMRRRAVRDRYNTPIISRRISFRESPKQLNMEVFFRTSSARLSSTAEQVLDEFVKNYDGGEIAIEGHADNRGSSRSNLKLGQNRAQSIESYLVKAFKSAGVAVPKIETFSLGESRSSHNLQQSRKGVVLSGISIVDRALTMISGDVYLVDSSGSMKAFWQELEGHQFSGGSTVCNFDSDGVSEGIGSPKGGTPLWESMDTVLSRMERGQTLVVLSDGKNSRRYHRGPSQLIQLARSKGIKISVIYIDSEPDRKTTRSLAEIATRTGGRFYLRSGR